MYRHIVGYTFKAANFCPDCIIDQLPTGPGEAFDGWALAEGVQMSAEANLGEIAYAFGIDRDDETSFDSEDFPKVILTSESDYCDSCGGEIK